jgi:hypothetical protein
MKNLQNLKGAHLLSKNEQLSINGGTDICDDHCSGDSDCGGQNRFCTEYYCGKSTQKLCSPAGVGIQ